MHAQKTNVHGVGIQIEDHGGSGNAVLFIHHGGSNLRMWNPVIPFFADGYRCITVDLRGHGRSDAPATGYHIDDMARDVVGVLDSLGILEVHIVGSSIGAEVGLSLATHYPNEYAPWSLKAPSIPNMAPTELAMPGPLTMTKD